MRSLFLQQFLSYTPISASLNPLQTSTTTPNKTTLNNAPAQNCTPSTNKTPKLTLSSDPNSNSNSNAPIKAPTAPWMKSPLFLQPHELVNPSEPPRKNRPSKNANQEKYDKALTGKERGVRGKKVTEKVVKRMGRLKKIRAFSVNTRESSGDVEVGESLEGLGGDMDVGFSKRLPWVREEKVVYWKMKKEKVVTEAELSLDEELLGRLRAEAATIRKWVKVKKAGVTDRVVDEIRLAWKSSELAMVKFDRPLCRNMDRAREIVELKTGGLVVWNRKDAHVVYRGHNYQLMENSNTSSMDENLTTKEIEEESVRTAKFMEKDVNILPINGSLFERETNRLLDGLGPRFVDWWMRKPLPVDADLLPEVVPGFMPPSRHCLPSVRPKLADDELTYWRRIAYALPTHFVLGRNRKLQGLASAIIKLWEKSPIAKIAVKWGILNTNNEKMAYELKYLTGGVLLLRNKFFIILYRGKDFLPCQVANLIVDREQELWRCQLDEERARLKATETFYMAEEPLLNSRKVGTLHEFQDVQVKFGKMTKGSRESELQLEAEREKLERELRTQERRLLILQGKIEKAARELSKLNAAWTPTDEDADQEMVTEEERECFRKIGLKMHSSLVLGRRGVFDGVIEGLHQHWKHREVVKVITMQRKIAQVMYTANFLEAESGGVLVSVDKLKEGHAIIIYRGKNYRRPSKLLAENLLTKRGALHRSLHMQRIGSLKFFAYKRQSSISEIKLKLAELQESRENI